MFGVLDVPASPGLGAPFDLGTSAGAFKTIILRGTLPPGSRYTVLGSMDGVRFDEVMLFTSDQQGARPIEFFCRFLRVRRDAGGPAPVIAFGCEGILEAGTGPTEISLADAGETATSSADAEEVLRQYRVPLSLLAPANLRVALAGESLGGSEGTRNVTFRVRAGGTPDVPDGTTLLTVPDTSSGSTAIVGDSPAFARPSDPSTLIKLAGQGDAVAPAVLRNFVLLFHADT